jgi:hypothetical protein
MALGFQVKTTFGIQDKTSGPLGTMQGKVNKFADAANSALSRIVPKGGIFGSIAGQVAIGNLAAKGMEKAFGAVRNTIASIPEAARRFDEIAKTSVRLGMSTDALQKYRYATEQAGVSNEQLNTAFMFLNKGMGNGTLVTALKKIDSGLARQVSHAPDSASAFSIISKAMSNEGNVAKRTAAMMATFGKSGNALVTMLPTLSAELKNAEKYGNIIPHSALATAEIFNSTVSRVKSMVRSFGDTIRGSVLRYITPMVMMLQDWIAANRELIRTKIESFIRGAVKAVNNFIRVARTLSPIFSAMWEGVRRIAGNLSPLIGRAGKWIEANQALIKNFAGDAAAVISTVIKNMISWASRAVKIIIRLAPTIRKFIFHVPGLKPPPLGGQL